MKRILFIEPNTVLAQLYQRMLSAEGFEVRHVVGAQAAIDVADLARPDVVVLELQLPKHGGIEFLHEFRSYPEWNDIPVIINTVITPSRLANLQTPLRKELGVAAILYKPKTSLQQLLQTVREQLVKQ